jgi:hypothetical protein
MDLAESNRERNDTGYYCVSFEDLAESNIGRG